MSPPPVKAKTNLKLLLLLLTAVGVFGVFSYVPKGAETPQVDASPDRPRSLKNPSDPESVPDLASVPPRAGMSDRVARNVFRFYDAPTPTPRPIPTPTPTPFPPCSPHFVGPCPIQPTPTPTPIVPPAIPYKALGLFGPREAPIVSLEEGSRIINASEGDTLDGKFIIRKINRESVDFAFTGLPPEITRRIPIPLP
jgi:hypothetical protein